MSMSSKAMIIRSNLYIKGCNLRKDGLQPLISYFMKFVSFLYFH